MSMSQARVRYLRCSNKTVNDLAVMEWHVWSTHIIFLFSVTPSVCRTKRHSSHPQQEGHGPAGHGQSGHHMKVILLEWVKGSNKMNVQLSNQRFYSTDDKTEELSGEMDKIQQCLPGRTSRNPRAAPGQTRAEHSLSMDLVENNKMMNRYNKGCDKGVSRKDSRLLPRTLSFQWATL